MHDQIGSTTALSISQVQSFVKCDKNDIITPSTPKSRIPLTSTYLLQYTCFFVNMVDSKKVGEGNSFKSQIMKISL